MKIPKFIKIGCHNVPILYPYVFEERYDCHGLFDGNLMQIMLSDDNAGIKRPDSITLSTLLHEILHAIEHVTGHKVFANMKEQEEEAVHGFAECIAQILIDNKFIKLGDFNGTKTEAGKRKALCKPKEKIKQKRR